MWNLFCDPTIAHWGWGVFFGPAPVLEVMETAFLSYIYPLADPFLHLTIEHILYLCCYNTQHAVAVVTCF